MSRSPPHREQSPDESGYFTHIPRGDTSGSEDFDPSEHSFTESGQSFERSVTPSTDSSTQSAPRVRARATARMSVRPPVRETFTIPCRDEAGPSRPRGRRVSPPPCVEIPVPRPAGMTAAESYWVSGMSRDMELFRTELEHHGHYIDALLSMLSSSNQIVDGVISMMSMSDQMVNGIMGELVDTRATVRRLYACLSVGMGFVVVVIA